MTSVARVTKNKGEHGGATMLVRSEVAGQRLEG